MRAIENAIMPKTESATKGTATVEMRDEKSPTRIIQRENVLPKEHTTREEKLIS